MARKNMGYGDSWSERAENLMYAAWYPVREVLTTMANIQKIDFSVATQRDSARQTLNKMAPMPTPLYDYNKRFPPIGTYVCEALGDWPTKLTQIREALTYKDRVKDHKETVGKGDRKGKGPDQGVSQAVDGSQEGEMASRWDYNDALHAFYTGIRSVQDQIGSMNEVYGQRSFEAKMGLLWNGPLKALARAGQSFRGEEESSSDDVIGDAVADAFVELILAGKQGDESEEAKRLRERIERVATEKGYTLDDDDVKFGSGKSPSSPRRPPAQSTSRSGDGGDIV